MGKNSKAFLKKVSSSPLVDKLLVSLIGILAGTMLDLILNKLDSIEKIHAEHIYEFKEFYASERAIVSALAANQTHLVLRQEQIYGEQKQRTPLVYGKKFPGFSPYEHPPHEGVEHEK